MAHFIWLTRASNALNGTPIGKQTYIYNLLTIIRSPWVPAIVLLVRTFPFVNESMLCYARLSPSPAFDPPREFEGRSADSFSRTAAGNRTSCCVKGHEF